MTYLLDTDICIFFLRGKYGVIEDVEKIGRANCCVSIISIFELKFGGANSKDPQKHEKMLKQFMEDFQVIPLDYDIANTFAQEKVRLRKAGTPIDNFDLLIGSTALAKDLIMVSNNQKHFKRLDNIQLENWVAGKR